MKATRLDMIHILSYAQDAISEQLERTELMLLRLETFKDKDIITKFKHQTNRADITATYQKSQDGLIKKGLIVREMLDRLSELETEEWAAGLKDYFNNR